MPGVSHENVMLLKATPCLCDRLCLSPLGECSKTAFFATQRMKKAQKNSLSFGLLMLACLIFKIITIEGPTERSFFFPISVCVSGLICICQVTEEIGGHM